MKNTQLIFTAVTLAFAGAAYSKEAQWMEPVAQKNTNLIEKIESPVINSSTERVSFSYKLATHSELDFNTTPYTQTSRQYWLDSSSDKLQRGVKLPVTGGSTIIRISPLTNNKSLQLTADMIELQNNGALAKPNVFADSEALKATGAPFSDQSIALKVEATQGQINLKVKDIAGEVPFVIHVFEPKSPMSLNLNATKATFGVNEAVEVVADLRQFDKSVPAEIKGYINRPDGSVLGELAFSMNEKGNYTAKLPLNQSFGLAQGLWEVHTFAKGQFNGSEVLRDAQTSFAVNLNSAKFNGQLKQQANSIDIGVSVGAGGRYEVRGVLMGTDKNGDLKPFAMTMTANWLEKGAQNIKLDIDQKLVAESGLSAPFQLKNVQLMNQSHLAPVQTVVSGIRLLDFSRDEVLRSTSDMK